MDAPKEEPAVLVDVSEIIKLADKLEKVPSADLLRVVARQREIHFPPPNWRMEEENSLRASKTVTLWLHAL